MAATCPNRKNILQIQLKSWGVIINGKDSEARFYGTRGTHWSSFGKPNKLKEIITFSKMRRKEYSYLHL
jgi:hypothetical protein